MKFCHLFLHIYIFYRIFSVRDIFAWFYYFNIFMLILYFARTWNDLERSKRRDLLALGFIAKSISKKLLITKNKFEN